MNSLSFLGFCAISCRRDIPLVTERFIISRNCLPLICDVVGKNRHPLRRKKDSPRQPSSVSRPCPIFLRSALSRFAQWRRLRRTRMFGRRVFCTRVKIASLSSGPSAGPRHVRDPLQRREGDGEGGGIACLSPSLRSSHHPSFAPIHPSLSIWSLDRDGGLCR